jgi:hypothetical protein
MSDLVVKPRMSDPPVPLLAAETSEQSIYNRTFWLAFLANTALVFANALTFRFAQLVH